MGAFLDKPKTEKYNESKSGAGLRYGLSSMQGWRIEMEDAHSAIIGIPDIGENVSWFAVFDGHAGSRVSAHCSDHLLDCISSVEDFKDSLRKEHTLGEEELLEKVKAGILNGFLELDEKLRKIPEVANGEDKSGTTAVCALITEKYVLFSNCGDSRGVLSGEGSKPVLATLDHKPSNPPERERIQNAGGSVMIQRVNGSLAVSRALGDFEYKNVDGKGPTEQLVSPEPEFYYKVREPEKDEFLVLACDGVWDVMTNEDICSFIAARMRVTDDLEQIANEVIDTCLHKGSRDNMSIIIIAFPAAPKIDPEAQRKDEELNKLLQQKVADIVKENENDIEFSAVFQRLAEEDFPDLPPGGGIHSKKVCIEEAYNILLPGRTETSILGMKACDTSCPVCSYILISDEISSTTTQEKFPIDGSFNCKTSGTVYVITCTKCNKQYVGQTGSQLKERILDHLQYIDGNEELTGEHFNLPDHSHSDMKVQIVEKIRPNSEENRREREEFWIEKISTKAPHGLNKND